MSVFRQKRKLIEDFIKFRDSPTLTLLANSLKRNVIASFSDEAVMHVMHHLIIFVDSFSYTILAVGTI